jgi:hypothetical protein
MPDTTIARQTRSANAQRVRHLLNEWDDTQKPALDRIIDRALDLLHALDMARVDLMLADDIAKVDSFACDTAGQTIDLLNTLLATQRRELDACGGDEDDMRLDLSALEDEHMGWETRWNARRPATLKVL